jgi:CubicO group peptidase (beta-lactamase class C family)
VQQQQLLHIPGLALVIVEDDRVVYAKGFGLRDVAKKLPVTLDTVFPIGSCTKAFTAMTIARAQDAGRLSFADHPRTYLPYFKMADPTADAEVTLVDMLSHRTGLMAYNDLSAEPGVLTMDEYMRAATSAKPTAPFRTKFQYNNAMIVAAGEVVGLADHSSWAEAVTRDVLAPLGMRATTPDVFAAMRLPDHATGYTYDAAKGWQAVPPPATLRELAPAGAIASSANDMTRWLRMLTDGGVVDGEPFVSPAAFAQMTTPQMAVRPGVAYGLGWALYGWNGNAVVEHNGGSEGISALVSFIPTRRTGFMFLANASPTALTQVGSAAKWLYPLVLGEPAPAASASPGAPAATPAPAASSAPFPQAAALVARAVAALGGASAMQRHTTLRLEEHKSFANQGIAASAVVLAQAPGAQETSETWSAAGRTIGRLRFYFDGTSGGQETTFGQNASNQPSENAAARRADRLHPLLSLNRDFPRVRVVERATVAGEAGYVLELTPPAGDPVYLTLSLTSGLPLQRRGPDETETYGDYRSVDGERVPFSFTIDDALGETDVRVLTARFGVVVPAGSFAKSAHLLVL